MRPPARPARVGIDALALAVGGGVTWLRHLAPALADVWREASIDVLARPDVVSLLGRGSARPNLTLTARRAPRGALRVPFERFVVPRWARRSRLDVILVAADAGPTSAPCPYVQVAQNAKIYSSDPDDPNVSRRYRWLRRAAVATARGAAATVFVSKALQAVAEPVLLPKHSFVVPHGVMPAPAGQIARPPRAPDGPYVLVVATPYAHKDIATALDAVLALRSRGRRERLVHVGGGGDADVLEGLVRRATVDPDALVLAGEATADELESWYAHASALMLPSRDESFGMPVADAIARGVPVVASNIPALLETAAGHARHHAVGDVESASRLLEAALRVPASRGVPGGDGPPVHSATPGDAPTTYAAARTWAAAAQRVRDVLEPLLVR